MKQEININTDITRFYKVLPELCRYFTAVGTASEIALAIKNNKKVILLNNHSESQAFFISLSPKTVFIVNTPEDAIQAIKNLL